MNLELLPSFAGHDIFHVVIESPRGSTLKLKYCAEWEAMGISRPLPAGLVFPFESGFVPSTRNADGDPLDVFVVWDVCSFPGVVLSCRALGVLKVEQNAVNFDASRRIRNDRGRSRIEISVASSRPRWADDVLNGHGREFNWDFSTEIQRQVTPTMSMSGGYYRNWYGALMCMVRGGWCRRRLSKGA